MPVLSKGKVVVGSQVCCDKVQFFADLGDLPPSGAVDTLYVVDNNSLYIWNGTSYETMMVQSVTGTAVDNTDPANPVINIPSNLIFYSTSTSSGILTYNKLVTSLDDPDYDTVAVDVPIGPITSTGQLVGALVSEAGIFSGNPGTINISTIGEIRRVSGTGTAEFYFEVYQRDSLGVETLICTSNNTSPVSSPVYQEFDAAGLFNNGTWTPTDRVVIKYYATRIPGGSNPSYQFLFGGTNPVRTLFPVSASLLLNVPIAVGVTTVTGGTPGSILTVGPTGLLDEDTLSFDSTPTNGSTNPVTSDGIFDALALKQNALTNPVTGTGTSGQIVYWSGTTTQTGSQDFTWNDTTKILSFSNGGTLINEIRVGSINTNTIIGRAAGSSASLTGTNNSFFGVSAGQSGTTGSGNSFFGKDSGLNNTTGTNNSSFGLNAGRNITSNFNSFFGAGSGQANTSGASNSFFGANSGIGNTTGGSNTFIGYQTAINNTSGGGSIVIGRDSARFIADGVTTLTVLNNSILIGNEARANANSQTNQTVIGYQAIGLGSNTTVIGNSSTTQTWLGGNLTLGTTTSGGRLTVRGSGTTSATTALLVQNSTPSDLLQILDNGRINQTIPGSLFSTSFGFGAGASQFGTAFGSNAGAVCTGSNWVSIGTSSASSSTNNNNWISIGASSATVNTTGDDWISIGYLSSRFYSGGFSAATSFSNGVYIGSYTKVGGAGSTNEIVIGYSAEGLGSDTTVIGNTLTTKTWLGGDLTLGTTTSSGRLTVRGSGTSSSANAILAEDSSGTDLFTVRNDGGFSFKGGTVGLAQTGYTTFTNLTTDRTGDANSGDINKLFDIVGTLIEDLKSKGIISA